MSYRTEKEENGGTALIIDGFEDGIANSPYKGIGNIRNLNINFYEGVAYVNYKRKPCTFTGATLGIPVAATQSSAGIIYISDLSGNIFKQSAVNGTTFSALTGNPNGVGQNGLQFWNNYLIAVGSQISICGDGTGDAGITSGNWDTGSGSTGVWPIINATLSLTGGISVGDTSTTISSYTDAKGNSRAFWNGPSGSYIMTIGSSNQIVLAQLAQGSAAITFTPAATGSPGSSVTINTVTGATLGPNHPTYISLNDGNMYMGNGANVASLQQSSSSVFKKNDFTTFTFSSSSLALPPTETVLAISEIRNTLIIGTYQKLYPWDRISSNWQNPIPMQENIAPNGIINILNNLYIQAGNKGNLYISNGYNVQRFKKLPDYIAGAIDPAWRWAGIMSHRQKLFIRAIATNSQNNLPILDGIFSVNLDTGALNMESQNSYGLTTVAINIFTFTGTLSANATSGTLTGSWSNPTGSYRIVFSNGDIRLGTFTNSSTSVTWTTGLTATATASITVSAPPLPSTVNTGATVYDGSNGILIDNNSIALNYDNYYSLWGSLSSSGGDFNDTTLWSSNEPVIETDIIPIGTFAQSKTFSSMEFKLDQPMQSGDSITVYARNSLAGTYTQLGTTTTAVLSDFYQPLNFQKYQWVQFEITMSCNSASTASSFMRLREVRIR